MLHFVMYEERVVGEGLLVSERGPVTVSGSMGTIRAPAGACLPGGGLWYMGSFRCDVGLGVLHRGWVG